MIGRHKSLEALSEAWKGFERQASRDFLEASNFGMEGVLAFKQMLQGGFEGKDVVGGLKGASRRVT